MGVYNTVKARLTCPHCHQQELFEVQFYYGEMWLYEYSIGDELIWGGPLRKYKFSRAEREKLDPALLGGNDIGKAEFKKVVVDAKALNCPNCGHEGPDCEVWIEDGKIADVRVASGAYKFISAEEPYFVVTL